MTTWVFASKWRRSLFVWLVRPAISRMRGPLACQVVLRAGVAAVGAHRAVGRHRRGGVTCEVRCE